MDACTNPDILRVIWFFLIIIDIVKIIVPIGLIIMGIIDFSKAVATSDEQAQKKNANLFMKRILYAILVFAVPWIVKVVMISLGNLTDGVNFTDCLENANAEKIAKLDKIEENKEEGLKCWQCNSPSNIYYWGKTYSSTSACPSGWHTLNIYVEEECGIEKCWYCPTSKSYSWSVLNPKQLGQNCDGIAGGQWFAKDDITEENCK